MEILKINNYYQCIEEKGCYIFYNPIPNKLKIITLYITRNLPREIKEQILHKLIVGFIKDRRTYEIICEIFENELYHREVYESS